jgi:polyhydroxyalkanoate synthesis regulator phasin
MYEKIKKWYKQGLWTEKMVDDAVDKGVITQEEAEQIIKEG